MLLLRVAGLNCMRASLFIKQVPSAFSKLVFVANILILFIKIILHLKGKRL